MDRTRGGGSTKKRVTKTLQTGRKVSQCKSCHQPMKGHSPKKCSANRASESVPQDWAAEGVQVGSFQGMPSGSGHLQPEAHQTEQAVNSADGYIQPAPFGNGIQPAMEHFPPPLAITLVPVGQNQPTPMSNPEHLEGFQGHVQGDNMYGQGIYYPNAYGAIAGPSNFAYGQYPMASSSYPPVQQLPLSNTDPLASGDRFRRHAPYQVGNQVATNPMIPMAVNYNGPLVSSGPGPSSMANYPQSAVRQPIPSRLFSHTPPASPAEQGPTAHSNYTSPASDGPNFDLPPRPRDPMRRNLANRRNNGGA